MITYITTFARSTFMIWKICKNHLQLLCCHVLHPNVVGITICQINVIGNKREEHTIALPM